MAVAQLLVSLLALLRGDRKVFLGESGACQAMIRPYLSWPVWGPRGGTVLKTSASLSAQALARAGCDVGLRDRHGLDGRQVRGSRLDRPIPSSASHIPAPPHDVGYGEDGVAITPRHPGGDLRDAVMDSFSDPPAAVW
jgi:hypothetical protein